jgi:hypothetical protein
MGGLGKEGCCEMSRVLIIPLVYILLLMLFVGSVDKSLFCVAEPRRRSDVISFSDLWSFVLNVCRRTFIQLSCSLLY